MTYLLYTYYRIEKKTGLQKSAVIKAISNAENPIEKLFRETILGI